MRDSQNNSLQSLFTVLHFFSWFGHSLINFNSFKFKMRRYKRLFNFFLNFSSLIQNGFWQKSGSRGHCLWPSLLGMILLIHETVPCCDDIAWLWALNWKRVSCLACPFHLARVQDCEVATPSYLRICMVDKSAFQKIQKVLHRSWEGKCWNVYYRLFIFYIVHKQIPRFWVLYISVVVSLTNSSIFLSSYFLIQATEHKLLLDVH